MHWLPFNFSIFECTDIERYSISTCLAYNVFIDVSVYTYYCFVLFFNNLSWMILLGQCNQFSKVDNSGILLGMKLSIHFTYVTLFLLILVKKYCKVISVKAILFTSSILNIVLWELITRSQVLEPGKVSPTNLSHKTMLHWLKNLDIYKHFLTYFYSAWIWIYYVL